MIASMIVDCASCPVRGHRCGECVVTALENMACGPTQVHDPEGLPLEAAERRAVSLFVAAGLLERSYAATLTARATAPAASRATAHIAQAGQAVAG
ncbi:MAG: hypothetical protein IPL45_07420 [Actinomycetales bacterium]|nr:hypothetical protein [Actinomycetales bacterium]